MYNWHVSICRCLANADQAHRMLCCTSVASWSRESDHLLQILYFPSRGSISICISRISISLSLFAFWLVRILVLLGWISSPCTSVLFCNPRSFFELFQGARHHEHVVSNLRLDMQSLFSSPNLTPKPFSFQVSMSFSNADQAEEETTQGVALLCSTSDPEFITFHVNQYGGALISGQYFRKQTVVH